MLFFAKQNNFFSSVEPKINLFIWTTDGGRKGVEFNFTLSRYEILLKLKFRFLRNRTSVCWIGINFLQSQKLATDCCACKREKEMRHGMRIVNKWTQINVMR